jgi:hypothetical protein
MMQEIVFHGLGCVLRILALVNSLQIAAILRHAGEAPVPRHDANGRRGQVDLS